MAKEEEGTPFPSPFFSSVRMLKEKEEKAKKEAKTQGTLSPSPFFHGRFFLVPSGEEEEEEEKEERGRDAGGDGWWTKFLRALVTGRQLFDPGLA